jgi:tRNA(Ile)-lysidine synthase
MEFPLDLDPERTYLAAVSGGGDSMALLALCLAQGITPIVAMVNYRTRPTSDQEEQLVRDYCAGHGLVFTCAHPGPHTAGNFEQWAREQRYSFFRQIYEQYHCDALLVGHQLDDSLENYLMAGQRGSRGRTFGIPRESRHHGMRIIRPLLPYRRAQLREYDRSHQVPYLDDASNASDRYTRNRIRHQLVEPASDAQVSLWLARMAELNRRQEAMAQDFARRYGDGAEVDREAFIHDPRQPELLRWMVWLRDPEVSLSCRQVSELCRQITTARHGHSRLPGGWEVVWEYGKLYLWQPGEGFRYILNGPQLLETPYFRLAAQGTAAQGITLQPADFPLIIRSWRPGDAVEKPYGRKLVARWFVDRKVPRKQRFCWPVVESRGTVIFACGLGPDVRHFSSRPTVFMLK